MRAFSRIPSTGGGSAGQGYVAGQSNRLTSATYFDANGVMRVAPPKALRPNYVYKNGVWVLDGWLREGASQNCQQLPGTNIGAYGAFPESYLVTKDGFANAQLFGDPRDTQDMIGSVYVLLSHPETTATRLVMAWQDSNPDGAYIDLINRVVVGNSSKWHLGCEDLGTSLRAWIQGGSSDPIAWGPFFIPRNGAAVMACFQTEVLASDGNPTSWVPYGTTRAAD